MTTNGGILNDSSHSKTTPATIGISYSMDRLLLVVLQQHTILAGRGVSRVLTAVFKY